MWINETLTKNNLGESPHIGVVTDIVNGLITVSSHIQLANVQVANSFGFNSLPKIGQQVVVMPTKNGEYVCIGEISPNNSNMENQVIIKAPSGAYIKLCSDGNIVINGLTITTSGTVIPAPTE